MEPDPTGSHVKPSDAGHRLAVSGPDHVTVGRYEPPRSDVVGHVHGTTFQPRSFSLWRAVGRLDPPVSVHWDDVHGDEAVLVTRGLVELNGIAVLEGNVAVIEAGAPAQLVARSPAEVLHFGPTDAEPPTGGLLGPPRRQGHRVHVVAATEAPLVRAAGDVDALYFADGTCETCRAAIFVIDGRRCDDYVARSHSHSEDEIIHVLDGTLRFGSIAVGPGECIAIPAGHRYGFRSVGPFRFVNYRRDVATGSIGPEADQVTIIETVATLRALPEASG